MAFDDSMSSLFASAKLAWVPQQHLTVTRAELVTGGVNISMAMVVLGHICTRNIMVIHIIYRPRYCFIAEAICVALTTCNLVGELVCQITLS